MNDEITNIPEHAEQPQEEPLEETAVLPATLETDNNSEPTGAEPYGSAPGAIYDTPHSLSLPDSVSRSDSTSMVTAYTNEDRMKARLKKKHIKEEKLQQICAYVATHGEISNDQVERLIGVSDTTAAKYIKELVRDGRLEKIGRGWQTRYVSSRAATSPSLTPPQ